jgi:hypothetical protein
MKLRLTTAAWAILSVVSLLLPASGAEDPSGIVRAARSQIGRTLRYEPGYRTLDYPNGDVPIEVGVCTDVVVRALRSGPGLDLQKAVHEDMQRHFSRYPQNWSLKGADKNIDHRRVPNLQTYFQRTGCELPVSRSPGDYRAGDLVTCLVPPNLPHIMIVSDRTNGLGRHFVIHNIGAGTQEEDRLFEFKITGHYRITKTASIHPAGPSQLNRGETNQPPSAPGSRR